MKKLSPRIFILLILILFVGCSANPSIIETQHPITGAEKEASSETSTAGAPSSTENDGHQPLLPIRNEAPILSEKDYELKYASVLNELRDFITTHIHAYLSMGELIQITDSTVWEHMFEGLYAYRNDRSTNEFGYAFKDIDENGIAELFLLQGRGPDSMIWAVYTLVNDTPHLLKTFIPRGPCFIDESTYIYTHWSDGATDNGDSVFRISDDGKSLEHVETVGIESYDDGEHLDEPRYYRIEGAADTKRILSEAEAHEATANFPRDNEKSGLVFIPLARNSAINAIKEAVESLPPDVAASYLEILNANKDAIRLAETDRDWHTRYTVSVIDICGDDTPELCYFAVDEHNDLNWAYNSYPYAYFNIWTFENQSPKLLLKVEHYADGEANHYFTTVGGDLYICQRAGQETEDYSLERYGFQDGALKLCDILLQTTAPEQPSEFYYADTVPPSLFSEDQSLYLFLTDGGYEIGLEEYKQRVDAVVKSAQQTIFVERYDGLRKSIEERSVAEPSLVYMPEALPIAAGYDDVIMMFESHQ